VRELLTPLAAQIDIEERGVDGLFGDKALDPWPPRVSYVGRERVTQMLRYNHVADVVVYSRPQKVDLIDQLVARNRIDCGRLAARTARSLEARIVGLPRRPGGRGVAFCLAWAMVVAAVAEQSSLKVMVPRGWELQRQKGSCGVSSLFGCAQGEQFVLG